MVLWQLLLATAESPGLLGMRFVRRRDATRVVGAVLQSGIVRQFGLSAREAFVELLGTRAMAVLGLRNCDCLFTTDRADGTCHRFTSDMIGVTRDVPSSTRRQPAALALRHELPRVRWRLLLLSLKSC